MILQPVMPGWLVFLLFLPILGFVVWCLIGAWKSDRRNAWIRRAVMVLLIFVMFLRPSLPGATRATGSSALDVYFLMDTTTSSSALDYDGGKQRIEGMRQDIKDIANALVGARFSLITFDNDAISALPLTTDTSTLTVAVDTAEIKKIYYGNGSSIDKPIELAKKELQRIAEKSPGRGRVVFYLGDGEQTNDSSPKSFSELKQYIDGGAVLGYGTANGGKMRDEAWDSSDDTVRYIKDYSTEGYPAPDALSKIDEGNLRRIADQLGVKYIHREKPGNVEEIANGINIGEITRDSKDITSYDDTSWVFAPALLALLSFDVWMVYKNVRKLKRVNNRKSA